MTTRIESTRPEQPRPAAKARPEAPAAEAPAAGPAPAGPRGEREPGGATGVAGDAAAIGSPTAKRGADPQAALLAGAPATGDVGARLDAALAKKLPKGPRSGRAPGGGAGPTAEPPAPAGPPKSPAEPAAPAGPPKTPAEARANAERLRDVQKGQGKINRDGEEGPLGVTFERDLMHANGKGTPAQQAEARQQLAANQPLEQAARAAMSPAQRAQYDHLSKSLEADPMTRLSLQTLAMDGKLTGGERSRDGTDLLGELAKMNDPAHPIAGSIPRDALVRGTINELAFPESIAQRDKSTCAPTVVQTLLAQRNPAEYARLVNGLAGTDDPAKLNGKPAGHVLGPDGQPMQRSKGSALYDASERTPSSQLLQAAFMERANGGKRYDNKRDANVDRKTRKADDGGLDTQDGDRLMRAIFPNATHTPLALTAKNPKTQAANQAQAMAEIERRVAAGSPQPVGMKWDAKDNRGKAHDEHAILVTRMANGRVYYQNPWGREESMDRAQFQRRLTDANLVDHP